MALSGSMLTQENVNTSLSLQSEGSWRRIKAYSNGGNQICAAGLGSESDYGTYPSCWTVSQVLNSGPLVDILRTPARNETPKEGVHWQRTSFVPRSIIFRPSNMIGSMSDEIGSYGTTFIQMIPTPSTILAECEQIPCADVGMIATPPTPPPGSSQWF